MKKKTSFGKKQEQTRRSLDASGTDAFHDADDGISAPDYAVKDRNESFQPYAHHLHPILGNLQGDTSMKGASIPRSRHASERTVSWQAIDVVWKSWEFAHVFTSRETL